MRILMSKETKIKCVFVNYVCPFRRDLHFFNASTVRDKGYNGASDSTTFYFFYFLNLEL